MVFFLLPPMTCIWFKPTFNIYLTKHLLWNKKSNNTNQLTVASFHICFYVLRFILLLGSVKLKWRTVNDNPHAMHWRLFFYKVKSPLVVDGDPLTQVFADSLATAVTAVNQCTSYRLCDQRTMSSFAHGHTSAVFYGAAKRTRRP